jgi:chromate transport protein ChrA
VNAPVSLEVLRAFATLGLTSFGGPVAHIGYFRREFVERRRWLTEAQFTQLVGITQLLPGPASSQLGFAVGLLRAGWPGALAAFVAFTLPSALLLYALSATGSLLASPVGAIVVHGLKLVAVAVVAHAVVRMAHGLTPDLSRALIGLLAPSRAVSVSKRSPRASRRPDRRTSCGRSGAIAGRATCSLDRSRVTSSRRWSATPGPAFADGFRRSRVTPHRSPKILDGFDNVAREWAGNRRQQTSPAIVAS